MSWAPGTNIVKSSITEYDAAKRAGVFAASEVSGANNRKVLYIVLFGLVKVAYMSSFTAPSPLSPCFQFLGNTLSRSIATVSISYFTPPLSRSFLVSKSLQTLLYFCLKLQCAIFRA